MTNSKKGRPKNEIPTTQCMIRLTEEEHNLLKKLANENYMTKSNFVKYLLEYYLSSNKDGEQ